MQKFLQNDEGPPLKKARGPGRTWIETNRQELVSNFIIGKGGDLGPRLSLFFSQSANKKKVFRKCVTDIPRTFREHSENIPELLRPQAELHEC
jgi:hypothetical protein